MQLIIVVKKKKNGEILQDYEANYGIMHSLLFPLWHQYAKVLPMTREISVFSQE